MDPRIKDAVRNTEVMVKTILEDVTTLTKKVDSLKKDFKSIKRASVRKYKKENGES